MDDLWPNTERTDGPYIWRAGKRGRRVHILNLETSRTFCQIENGGGKPLDGQGAEIPAGRRLCQNCVVLARQIEVNYREPSLAVLMGERLAETEPELFVGTVAPEPWKRKKLARPVNRSKKRKPKRSTVKHPRPFDDDLPSW